MFKRDGWSRTDIDTAIREAGKCPGHELIPEAGGIEEGKPADQTEGEYAKFEPGALLMVQAGSHAALMSTIFARWEPEKRGSIPITREVKP